MGREYRARGEEHIHIAHIVKTERRIAPHYCRTHGIVFSMLNSNTHYTASHSTSLTRTGKGGGGRSATVGVPVATFRAEHS